MAWPLVRAFKKRVLLSNSTHRILSYMENRVAPFRCQFSHTLMHIMALVSDLISRKCLKWKGNAWACQRTRDKLQSDYFWIAVRFLFCTVSASPTWEGAWILIIAFIICYGKVPSVFEWQESHKPVFLSVVLPWVGNISHGKRKEGTCLNIKAAVWKGSWAARGE